MFTCHTGEIHALPVLVSSGDGENGVSHARGGKFGDASAPYSPSAASFNKKGDLIYVGNFKGEILVIDTHRRQTCTVVQLSYRFLGLVPLGLCTYFRLGFHLFVGSVVN